MSEHLYVTTTIPYVNAPPHIGHALELVQADAVARYHRLRGASVRLQTGTDENAFKNVSSAAAQGLPVRELVDRNAGRFRELASRLDVSPDAFVRTATPEHRAAVDAFLARLRGEDLYRGQYRGLYCPGCEDFFLERDLRRNGGCPDHGNVVVEISEENAFFRLSRYQHQLAEVIRSGQLRIVPEARRTEVLRFIERGLQDISISRDARRSGGWGLPFPGDPSQVVYVWIDALVNYLTGVGFPGSGAARFWGSGVRKLHVVGKNVWKFHAVYWPALLISAGLELPDEVFVHGFLTQEGRKISKSSGHASDPLQYVERFGADSVRYFLLRHVRPYDDSDFSESRLAEAHESELANGYGNLCSRLTALCERSGVCGVRSGPRPVPDGVSEHLAAYRFDRALEVLWDEVARINREIAAVRPWEQGPDWGPTRRTLERWAEELHLVTCWLSPFLPSAAARAEAVLTAATIRRAEPIFPRVPDARHS